MVEHESAAEGSTAGSYSRRPPEIGWNSVHDRRVRRQIEPRLQLQQLRGKADVALLLDDGRRHLLVQELDGHTRPVLGLGAHPKLIRGSNTHGSRVERVAKLVWQQFEHLLGDSIEGRGLALAHLSKKSAEGGVVAHIGQPPLLSVGTEGLGPGRWAHSGVKAEDAPVSGPPAHIGIVDASVDPARFRAYGGWLRDPLAGSLDARTFDNLSIGAEEPLDSAVGVVGLGRPLCTMR